MAAQIISRADAMARGLKTYFTGKPCVNGHIAERYVCDRGCIPCNRERDNRTAEDRRPQRERYYANHKEQMTAANRNWCRANVMHVRQRNERWRKANPEKKQKVNRRWRKKALATNLLFRLSTRLRVRLYKAVRGDYRGGSAVRDLGCSIAELKAWLEARFRPGMSWDNYGPVWHIDHKTPLAAFDLTDPAQFRQAVHYTNLQPLFADENRKKRALSDG